MKGIIAYLLLISISLSACAQSDDERSVFETFTAEQYRADLSQMANQLKSFHPKMYEYVSRDSFDRLVDEKLTSFTDSTSLGEFIWSAREISSLIACGHTFVPTLSRKFKIPDACIFPLYAKFAGEKLYVLENKGNTMIPIGSEITKINNRSVSNLKDEIKKVLSADGNNMSFKDQKINDDFMFLVSYELGLAKTYTIEFINNKGEIKTQKLTSLTIYDPESYTVNSCPEQLCFSINPDLSTATIRITSFVYYNDHLPEFKSFIDECFRKIELNSIENVLIDIRGNGGGDPYCASYLLQHIAEKPFQYYKKGTSDYYQDLQTEIPLMDNNFNGDIYTIIDGKCFSTSGHFLSLMKHYNIGTIVGRESGATYRCNATTTELNLRYTDISCYIARATYTTIAEELPANRGIIPDYIVEYTKEDLLNNKAPEIELINKLIEGN